MSDFNEDSRVKIPTILHLVRLGFNYLPLKEAYWDKDTNIFDNIFTESILRLNQDKDKAEVVKVLKELKLTLENKDLGKDFYQKLIGTSDIRLIDFDDFSKNQFDVVTELPYKNGEEEFRPDITLLVNGLPLIFIEVKKPNNPQGVLAERDRINKRFKNPKFRRFANITQLMVFSNNMEYDNEQFQPLQGAFYATSSYFESCFNYFREEEKLDLDQLLKTQDEEIERLVLEDNNLVAIRESNEFITNKNSGTPTNRLCTSLLSKERLAFLLKYSLAYIKTPNGEEKHIMRYPQIFASMAIKNALDSGKKKGIIWHTQGSGKTALAYYNVRYLTDYFQAKGIIPQFYFIVDRLDLSEQAQREFKSRGLMVHTVNSREDFIKNIKSSEVLHNHSGKPEITVVNIQKFASDNDLVSAKDYYLKVQRIYFLDEVHRSYNPKGSFLANLSSSDVNAIKIGLTGTPLLGNDYNSKMLFGDYIHKYYYNASIADGYTLRLIREDIESSYKMQLKQLLETAEVEKGSLTRQSIYSHISFVEPMLDYIIGDFERSRITLGDNTIGGMIICDSSKQAKEMFRIFEDKYKNTGTEDYRVKSAALILHNENTKEIRKNQIEDFKAGKIDLLLVYNMLLTGFDASRLKKLYLGRVIKDHNLLQALTRVNRPYQKFRYGYIVDFADIQKEFDKTNKAYFDELQSELGNEYEQYSLLFKSREEIEQEIEGIRNTLFSFNCTNAEIFSTQISKINDLEKLRSIIKTLSSAKSLYNLIRSLGHYDLAQKLDFHKLSILLREANNRLDIVNLKDNLNKGEYSGLLNLALENIYFEFYKVDEKELVLADKLKDILRTTRLALCSNYDTQDVEFISLREELERLFRKKNLSEISHDEMKQNIDKLNILSDKIDELNRKNGLLKDKYKHDSKYARIHKRCMEKGFLGSQDLAIHTLLIKIKEETDHQILQNNGILKNDHYFLRETESKIAKQFMATKISVDAETIKYISSLVTQEYLNEFNVRVE